MNLATDQHDPSAITTSERLILAGFIALFLIVNVLTASLSPTVWMDEVLYTDPAYRLATFGEFTSTAWMDQTQDRFFAENVPLYPFILAGWIKLLGFTVTTVRSLNFSLVAIAVWIAHSAAARSGLLRSRPSRLTFAMLLLLGHSFAMAYRSGRPDALTILISAASSWCLTLRPSVAKWIALAACSALAPMAGLQLAPYFALATLFLVVRFRKSAIPDASAIAIGGALGVAALIALYQSHGVLADFRAAVVPQAHGGDRAVMQTVPFFALYSSDWSLPPVLLVAFLGVILGYRGAIGRRDAIFLAAFAVVVPPFLQLSGKYPNYYGWMAFAPAAMAACTYAEQFQRVWKIAASLVFVVAMLVGLPARLGLAAFQFEARDYRPVEAFVRSRIKADDVVFCDYATYYPVRTVARIVYVQPHGEVMTPEQFREVTVVLGNPALDLFNRWPDKTGWQPTGAVHEWKPPIDPSPIADQLMKIGAVKYHIVEYRRVQPEAKR